MRTTLRLPGVSPGTSAFVLHLLSVFASAFAVQMVVAGVANVHDWPALLALVCSGAAAGLVAAVNLVLGLIPNLNVTLAKFLGSSATAQVITASLAVFLTTFGSQLAVGAAHAESIGTLYALVVAAITAGGSAVIHYTIGLVPVPAPAGSRETDGILAKKTAAQKAAK